MRKELENVDSIASNRVNLSIEGKERNPFLESLADARLSPEEIKTKLVKMLEALAQKSDMEARVVAESMNKHDPRFGTNDFELKRAQNLRNLANTINKHFTP